jgi:hypothetical protein
VDIDGVGRDGETESGSGADLDNPVIATMQRIPEMEPAIVADEGDESSVGAPGEPPVGANGLE